MRALSSSAISASSASKQASDSGSFGSGGSSSSCSMLGAYLAQRPASPRRRPPPRAARGRLLRSPLLAQDQPLDPPARRLRARRAPFLEVVVRKSREALPPVYHREDVSRAPP